MDTKDSEKKDRLLAALDRGMVMIHLDARKPGVVVPFNLKREAHLRLNLSFHFDPPDLSVGEWGARATLTFSGSRFAAAIPWSAIFAITSHVTQEFWLYPDDMPPELLQDSLLADKVPPTADVEAAPAPVKPVLRGLESLPVLPPEEQGEFSEPPAEKPKGRPHLRVVK